MVRTGIVVLGLAMTGGASAAPGAAPAARTFALEATVQCMEWVELLAYHREHADALSARYIDAETLLEAVPLMHEANGAIERYNALVDLWNADCAPE